MCSRSVLDVQALNILQQLAARISLRVQHLKDMVIIYIIDLSGAKSELLAELLTKLKRRMI